MNNITPLTRRHFLQTSTVFATLPWLGSGLAFAAPDGMPQSVQELWAEFDPRRDPLEVEVIREWKEDSSVFRHVRYLIGTFKGKPARMAAVYGFPDGAKPKLPAVISPTFAPRVELDAGLLKKLLPSEVQGKP